MKQSHWEEQSVFPKPDSSVPKSSIVVKKKLLKTQWPSVAQMNQALTTQSIFVSRITSLSVLVCSWEFLTIKNIKHHMFRMGWGGGGGGVYRVKMVRKFILEKERMCWKWHFSLVYRSSWFRSPRFPSFSKCSSSGIFIVDCLSHWVTFVTHRDIHVHAPLRFSQCNL